MFKNIKNSIESDSKLKVNINNFYKKKRESIFFKKQPKSESYPFKLQDPITLLGENSGLERFYLVGENWLNGSDKPIAVVFGCNDWKFGFIADYLKEFRVAFSPKKNIGMVAVLNLMRLKVNICQALVWGYTESKALSAYLNYKKISLWRIEDGFIRSSNLGASHSTPYSLVIDKTGFYYNCYEKSDIESMLNSYDFQSDQLLLSQAQSALDTILNLNLSKYNPAISVKKSRINIKKRIAVLGQVDSDASIRYGNPNNWNAEELIKLAAYENPGVEILYRPHPEIYKGYQKSKFRSNAVTAIAEVVSPEENIVDFLESVDHVYTITSLSGLEALIRGKKVTVVGAPFYAGWGLTDDRVQMVRRSRKLELLELFAGAYLLYPKYLANIDNSFVGLISACYKIEVDKYLSLDDIVKTEFSAIKEHIPTLLQSYKWPSIFLHPEVAGDEKKVVKYIKAIPFREIFQHKTGEIYTKIFSYFLVGVMPTDYSKNMILTLIRPYLDGSEFNKLLLDVSRTFPKINLLQHWSWILDEMEDDVLIKMESYSSLKKFYLNSNGTGDVNDTRELECVYEKENIRLNLLNRKLVPALESIHKLLLNGHNTNDVLRSALTVSELSFDFISVKKVALLLQGISLFESNRHAVLAEYRTLRFIHEEELNKYLFMLSKTVVLKPESIGAIKFNIDFHKGKYEAYPLYEIIESMLELDNEISIRKAQAYIAIQKFDKSVLVMERLIENGSNNTQTLVQYSQSLSYNNLSKALNVMELARKSNLNSLIVRESLRLFTLASLYKESLQLLTKAESLGIDIGDMHKRKSYFGNRMLEKAFETFKDIDVCKNVQKHFSNKYYLFKEELVRTEKVFLLAIFGPGDEIRFASIYDSIAKILNVTNVSIACSPRFFDLFSRSFSNIKFVPVERPRNSDAVDLQNYTNVPGSDIMGVIDNSAVQSINKSDRVLFVTDLLHKVLTDYSDFSGRSYLVAEPSLIKKSKILLPKNDRLVGLSWRSSLTTSARNEHYLSIQELEPIFRVEGVTFVNLQYDECSEELAWVEDRYPGKLVNIDGLDQYNDFDGVAALMKCMDLVIAPATTVVELAGALGCNTWMFSNSSEIDWRKIDKDGTDVWHNSITIIDVEEKGNKQALVKELTHQLTNFANKSH